MHHHDDDFLLRAKLQSVPVTALLIVVRLVLRIVFERGGDYENVSQMPQGD